MIPIRDSPRSRRTPYLTYAFIAINVIVFLYMITLSTNPPVRRAQAQSEFASQTQGICYGFQTAPTEVDRFYCRWSFQPREWFDAFFDKLRPGAQDRWQVLFTIITATFLHAGWLHIIGNMLFLWVFGDNVEDRLGRVGYLLFYLGGGAIAGLTQAWINTDSLTPNVGASGAIAAVLGGYLVFFPTATITALLPVVIILIPIPVPAVVMIGFWFLQNLLAGLATIGPAHSPDSGVAWFAHVGGFLAGMAVTFVVRAFQRGPPERG